MGKQTEKQRIVDIVMARIIYDDRAEAERDYDSGELTEVVLSDAVHDKKSREASAINNDGIDAQLEYLLK